VLSGILYMNEQILLWWAVGKGLLRYWNRLSGHSPDVPTLSRFSPIYLSFLRKLPRFTVSIVVLLLSLQGEVGTGLLRD